MFVSGTSTRNGILRKPTASARSWGILRIICGFLAGILLLTRWIGSASAAEDHTQFQLLTPPVTVGSPRETPFLVTERFADSLNRRADVIFADRLHAFNMVKWNLQLNGSRDDDFRERTTSAGKSALTKSLAYSVRDAIAESPFMLWLEDRQEFLAAFLRDSIDSVEEESVSPLDGSYGLVERSWWKNLRQNESIRYGIRPFRTSPYAFTSFAIRDQNHVFALGHIRYYYDRLEEHRFEIATSLPLAHGFSLDVGTSYELQHRHDPGRVALKIFKELQSGGICHFGFELRERPTLLAGITFNW